MSEVQIGKTLTQKLSVLSPLFLSCSSITLIDVQANMVIFE